MGGGQDCEKAGFMSLRPLQPWCFKGQSMGISHVTERGNARISHVTDTGNTAGIASERTYGWSGIKVVSGVCTWDGQSPGTHRIAEHPAYLDTPVLEPQIGASCALARVVGFLKSCHAGVLRIGCAIDHIEVAYQPTARRAEPESHQPRAIGDHESDLSCQRCAASVVPCAEARHRRRRSCLPRRPGGGATVRASRFCIRSHS